MNVEYPTVKTGWIDQDKKLLILPKIVKYITNTVIWGIKMSWVGWGS